MTKPVTHIDWLQGNGSVGSRIETPSGTLTLNGYSPGDEPKSKNWNFLLYYLDQWDRWAETEIDSLTAAVAGKQDSGNYLTALTGDVTASGPGSAAATIAAGAVTDSKVASNASIAFSKMAALTASKIMVTSGLGVAAASSVDSAVLAYLDATSSIQGQLDTKAAIGSSGFVLSQKTSAFSAAAGYHYQTDTSGGAYAATLPAGSSGAVIKLSDALETWNTGNLTITPASGERIDGLAVNESLVCDVQRSWVELSWNGSRWVLNAPTTTTFSNPLTTLGDTVYGASGGTLSRLAGNTTTTKKFLTQTGDGANSVAPGWNTIAAGDLPLASGSTRGAYIAGSAPGHTSGSAIAAGMIGETITNTFDVDPATAGTISTPTNVALTAGKWRVVIQSIVGGAASLVGCYVAISTDSGSSTFSDLDPTEPNYGYCAHANGATSDSSPRVEIEVLLGSSQTYYAKVLVAGANARVRGRIRATRIA